MSNPSVSVSPALSEKPSLAARFSQILAAFERSQMARADRVIRRFSYLGARVPQGEGKPEAEVNSRVAAAPYQRSRLVGISQ